MLLLGAQSQRTKMAKAFFRWKTMVENHFVFSYDNGSAMLLLFIEMQAH